MKTHSPVRWNPGTSLLAVAAVVITTNFWSIGAAHALVIGVVESYEGYSAGPVGNQDYRGHTRNTRLLEAIAGWNEASADFGVLNGDNLANNEIGWPLLLAAIEGSAIPIYLVQGNHDWVNQSQPDGSPHPDACFNLKPEEQIPSCPNTLYFAEYLQTTYGFERPWYSFEQEGMVFVMLADELYDPRGFLWGGVSDVHDEQFYWFRDIVATHPSQPIVVFAHHPVYRTIAGTFSPTSPLNRLGWHPRVGHDVGDTVSVAQGSNVVSRAGDDFDPRRVTVGSEFRIQEDDDWYTISSIAGNLLTLDMPYAGTTDLAASFWAGGHFNELTEIMKDPSNSIQAVLTGHTSGDFQIPSQKAVIGGKHFAYSGGLAPTEIKQLPRCDFTVGSPVVTCTHTGESSKIVPGSQLRTPAGSYVDIVDIDWGPVLGSLATMTLATVPNITQDYLNVPSFTKRTDPFTQTRLFQIDGANPAEASVLDFNYASQWLAGSMLEGDFDDPSYPSASLWNATLSENEDHARLTPTSLCGTALYGDSVQRDYEISVTLERVSGGGGGIAFRAMTEDDFYYFELDEASQSFKLGESFGGMLTTLAEVSVGAPLEDEYTISIQMRGSLIRAFVDDEPAILFESLTYPNGRYGLFTRSSLGSDFEDLEVFGDIAPIATPEPELTHMLLLGIFALERMGRLRKNR